MKGHENLCEHAYDARELYKIWNNDLKKTIKRRGRYETVAIVAFVGAIGAASMSGYTQYASAFVFVGGFALYGAVRNFVDESNTNYLMHEWDLRNMLRYFNESK